MFHKKCSLNIPYTWILQIQLSDVFVGGRATCPSIQSMGIDGWDSFPRGRRHAGQLEPHLDATKIFVFSFDRWKGSLIKSLHVGPTTTKQNSNSNKKI